MIYIAYFSIDGYNSYSGCDIVVTASLPNKFNDTELMNNYYTLGSLQTLSVSTHQDKRPVRSLGNINAKEYVMGPRTIAGSLVFAVFDRHFATEIMNDLGGALMPDEIPALNFTINMMNEYGRKSRMAIYGAKIVNEGQVMSINDLYTENTYQFVALGMEVLTNEINENSLGPGQKQEIITFSLIDDDVVLPESGKDKAGRMINNKEKVKGKEKEEEIILSVDVEQPLSKDDTGIATFTLKGTTEDGIIYINNSSGQLNLYRISTTASRKTYDKELPIGYYSAIYKSTSNKESNEVKFYVYVGDKEYIKVIVGGSYLPNNEIMTSVVSSYDNNYLPIIENVTDTSIRIRNNDAFSHVRYYTEGAAIKEQELGYKNTVLLENLTPNTLYYIYLTKNDIHSLTASVKTHATSDETLSILKQTVASNKDIISSDKQEMLDILEHSSHKEYETLIDLIIDSYEGVAQQELLIYSEFISNNLLKEYNRKSNDFMVEVEQGTPFDSDSIFEGVEDFSIYRNNNKKSYFSETVSTSENDFCAKPNVRYSLYGENNLSSFVRRDYVICKQFAYDELINYCDVNRYKSLDTSAIGAIYQTASQDLLPLLAIKEANNTDINILYQPHIYMEDDVVYADVGYMFLEEEKTYYLVISEAYKALDYYPRRKIEFTNKADVINLNANYCGIIEEEIYLMWIEDENCKKISQSTLFIPNEKDNRRINLDTINEALSTQYVNDRKAKFLTVYDNRSIVDDIFTIVKSKDLPVKSIDMALINESINVCAKTYYESNTLNTLALLIASLFNFENKVYADVTLNKSERTITYNPAEDSDYKIFALHIDDEEDGFIRLENNDNVFKYNSTGFTIVFICDRYSVPLSFFAIDNTRNKHMYYNMSRIKEV